MAQSSQYNQTSLKVQFPSLPLAVYKEIAAHLCQVEGVQTKLLPAFGTEFNYSDSQVESLQIQLPKAEVQCVEQVEKILAYYQSIFGTVERS